MNAVFECHHGWVVDLVDGDDAREPIGWRAQCSCGRWRGQPWRRSAHPLGHDPAERRLHSPSGRLDPTLTRLVLEDWECHQFEMRALMPVRLAFQDSESARQRLVEAVRFVRATGASWESIGHALGTDSAELAEQWFGTGATV
ncbi:hypothetical protein ACFWM1_29195 [Nocardia sp. NPDC058379]|uniref:hypothetical protein n=1 Tax=unclassified Nocardia TaxID=2637762 RepID=UPI0036612142